MVCSSQGSGGNKDGGSCSESSTEIRLVYIVPVYRLVHVVRLN